jgi:hypothetical protein
MLILVKNTKKKKTGTRILHYLCAIINFKFYSKMNRKMVLGGLLAIIIAAGAAWNVSLNSNVTDGNSSNITLKKVEALSGEWNPWYQWLTQGFTQDEEERQVDCIGAKTQSITIVVLGGGIIKYNAETPSAAKKITCPNGNQNCTETDC